MADNLDTVNKRPVPPDIKALLDIMKAETLAAINCHHLATIQSFNASNQTVSATINYKKTVNGNLVDYPVVVDCPAIIMSGGKAALTMPISVGDTCLLLFNDKDIDNWFSSGQTTNLSSPRIHCFSDAIALIGLRSLQNSISDYDSTRAVLRNDKAMVGVGPELIKIANDMTTLKMVINGLISLLETAYTIPTVPSSPATFDPAFIAQLEAYKATVGGLLE